MVYCNSQNLTFKGQLFNVNASARLIVVKGSSDHTNTSGIPASIKFFIGHGKKYRTIMKIIGHIGHVTTIIFNTKTKHI